MTCSSALHREWMPSLEHQCKDVSPHAECAWQLQGPDDKQWNLFSPVAAHGIVAGFLAGFSVSWLAVVPGDDVYTPEDIARQIGVDVEKPFEYSDTWEKPISVTTSPGLQHPPIPPVKPTQMRRKPLPPNTVTGKPGSPAKPAGPTTPVRTGTSYKTPTAFATPEYYVDATVFSSSPTSETDSSGKPRYQAPHVKYMKKDDDVPCSITSSLEHFPQEEAGSKEEPTHPPQNPPTNLTVVTVEGCPTFVILDWEKPDNDTVTEYEVVSTENGASDGEKEKSIITTNQTHSTVENLKPDT
ncbi:PREDICTED: target of Nesh-SH3-like, partial [Fulmarus glacialis]|uniref:target of Nesh-SH3-like n=1 Tax=Fulmarus glacialis TaxID=30455 RepID=UPI00051B83FE